MRTLKNIILFFLKLTLGFFLFLFIFSAVLFFIFIKDLPRPEIFFERGLAQSTQIFDRTGKILLYEIFGEERRIYVPFSEIPDHLKKAVIAVEDATFYSHFGIEPKAILRALLEDLKLLKPTYGASTISQQLIRSTYLTLEKTPQRKLREIILALELEKKYSKDQILEWYLNQIPLGQNAYGVEAASRIYFGKSVKEISLPEAAVLAALIKAPYSLSPYEEEGRKKLMERKNYVLDRMVQEGFLKREEAEKAKNEEIKFKERGVEILAPYFTLWVKEILEKQYGENFLKTGGLKVYTTLDFEIQKIAEEELKKGIQRNKVYNAFNGALVAIDPQTGDVISMAVGTGNYYEKPWPENCLPGKNCKFDPQFNVAVGTKTSPGRQPGSAFKPIIYATAFKKGYNDRILISDSLTNFGVWGGKDYVPQNYDGNFRGLVTAREALAQSLNVPSIKILYLIGSDEKIEILEINNFKGKEKILLKGLEESLKIARDLGISTLNKDVSHYGPSLVLGGGEVNLLELTGAYSVFANEGKRVNIYPILKIEDQKGNVIFEKKKEEIRVLPSEVARLITDILSDNEARAPIFGERSPLYFENFKVAVKTGTTQNYRDAWTIGYTSKITVGVWVGNNDNSPIAKKPGVVVAAPIWHNFLEKILPKLEK